MAHLQELSSDRMTCESTGNCTAYETTLRNYNSDIDARTASSNQTAVTWGLFIGLIGLVVLLTPFAKPLQAFQKVVLPKLAIAAPILIGLAVGLAAGFAITFSACYKQECSPIEGTAMFTLPALSLVLTIPITIRVYRKRQNMTQSINHPNTIIWVVVGTLIIMFGVTRTLNTLEANKRSNTYQKESLRR